MKTLALLAISASAVALVACIDTSPEETDTAAAMPDTSSAQSPAPDSGDTGVAGADRAYPGQDREAAEGLADTEPSLPPVNLPRVPN